MSRQAILERPDPPDITIILWEPVLHHQIGTSDTMREQAARLVALSDLPTVTIHVLPAHGRTPDSAGRSSSPPPTCRPGAAAQRQPGRRPPCQ
jgi:Domain of unknown function (DUF5753)